MNKTGLLAVFHYQAQVGEMPVVVYTRDSGGLLSRTITDGWSSIASFLEIYGLDLETAEIETLVGWPERWALSFDGGRVLVAPVGVLRAEFIESEQIWTDGATRYWFELYGYDAGTRVLFDGARVGVVEQGPTSTLVDSDGRPLSDSAALAARRVAIVTDDMRDKAAGLGG